MNQLISCNCWTQLDTSKKKLNFSSKTKGLLYLHPVILTKKKTPAGNARKGNERFLFEQNWNTFNVVLNSSLSWLIKSLLLFVKNQCYTCTVEVKFPNTLKSFQPLGIKYSRWSNW